MIRGLNSIILFSAAPARLAAFYEHALGLAPRGVGAGVAFDLGSVSLGVFPHEQVRGASRDPHRVVLNLEVDDVNVAFEHLSSEGVPFLKPPTLEAWGGRMATFSDPDGNLLQLVGPVEQPGTGQRRRALRWLAE